MGFDKKLRLVLVLLICSIFTSCSLFVDEYKDISTDCRVEHLVGRWMELKQDVFLYQYPDTKAYALDVPGDHALPFSVKEYLRNPLNWQHSDTNSKIGKGPLQGYLKFKVVSIIPAGTKIYVSKVLEKRTFYESFMEVIGYIDDPQFCHLPVNIYFLLKIEFGAVVIPYPSEPELSAMGREIIPHPKPGLLEYCDEE